MKITGIFIPFYSPFYGSIDEIIAAKQSNPNVQIAIIVGGIGESPYHVPDPDLIAVVAQMKAAGCVILGYTYAGTSALGMLPIEDVETDVQNWKAWYNVDGIFIDEADTVLESEYCAQLTRFIHAQGLATWGNILPVEGVIPPNWTCGFDVPNIYEGAGVPAGLPHIANSAMIAYTVAELPPAWSLNILGTLKWVYVTDLTAINHEISAYNYLPSYFAEEVAELN